MNRSLSLTLILFLKLVLLTACGSEIPATAVAGPADSPPPAGGIDYVTPPQQEGPYYPVAKPADRDNDLVALAGAAGQPAGEVLSLAGVVYDTSGAPLAGITVEIWQTDSQGIYDHPGDRSTAQRDPNFQFYGESTTGADGVYSFRTLIPGRYEPRPRHIHVKVRRGETYLLTTQFYFSDEVTPRGDEAHLIIDLAPAEDDGGNPIFVGERDIVVAEDR